jgi:hypothetical protein
MPAGTFPLAVIPKYLLVGLRAAWSRSFCQQSLEDGITELIHESIVEGKMFYKKP